MALIVLATVDEAIIQLENAIGGYQEWHCHDNTDAEIKAIGEAKKTIRVLMLNSWGKALSKYFACRC